MNIITANLLLSKLDNQLGISIGCRIRLRALSRRCLLQRASPSLVFLDRSQQVEVLILGKLLFERSVTVSFISTEPPTLDGRQNAPKRAEVVFASRRQSVQLR